MLWAVLVGAAALNPSATASDGYWRGGSVSSAMALSVGGREFAIVALPAVASLSAVAFGS